MSALKLTFSGPTTPIAFGQNIPTTLQKILSDRLSDAIHECLCERPSRVLICTDFDLRILAGIGVHHYSHKVLLRFEPEVVNPIGYTKTFESRFDAIIQVGRAPAATGFNLPWPQQIMQHSYAKELGDRIQDQFPIINANKISLMPGELYSLRRNLAKNVPGVVIFGKGWGASLRKRFRPLLVAALMTLAVRKFRFSALKFWFSQFPNWRGETKDKHATLSRFRTALVIENSREFLSEKLFDAWNAGCIPVYVGLEDLSSLDLPRHLMVEAEPNVSAIQSALEKATSIDFESFQSEVRLWLSSRACNENWGMERFVNELAASVHLIVCKC